MILLKSILSWYFYLIKQSNETVAEVHAEQPTTHCRFTGKLSSGCKVSHVVT